MAIPYAPHQKDGYKIGHKFQYPEGTEEIYANWTARAGNHSNVPTDGGVYFFGLQHFMLDYLIHDWKESFFKQPMEEVVEKYRRRVSKMLNQYIDVSHMEALHKLGYLPIHIKALPEGAFVPYGVPMFTIRNTHPRFYWVTNMLESVTSAEMWLPITSATTYMAYKKLFLEYAELTGSPKEFIPYQGHDFSMRGMGNRYAAASSGAAALGMGAVGTDTIAAIDLVEDYYGANVDFQVVGETVNATEHSVQCAGGRETELDTYIRLLTEVYPTGIVSIVSDTWDFWSVITDFLPKMHKIIMERDGKFVIRPDSGDPVKIITGYLIDTMYTAWVGSECVHVGGQYFTVVPTDENREGWRLGKELRKCEVKGLIQCLWEEFQGTFTSNGYKVLDSHIGAIYGDSITYERALQILERLANKGFASCNVVLGIGSFTYQYVTRDVHGHAMKSTHAIIRGQSTPIFKDPITDDGTKKSAKGYLMVVQTNGVYKLVDQVDAHQEKHGCLVTVFLDGEVTKFTNLEEVRALSALW